MIGGEPVMDRSVIGIKMIEHDIECIVSDGHDDRRNHTVKCTWSNMKDDRELR